MTKIRLYQCAVANNRDFRRSAGIFLVCSFYVGNGINGALLQVEETLCTSYLKEMGLLPEVLMRLGLSLCEVRVQMSLPGAEEDFPQFIQVANLCFSIAKGMLCSLTCTQTATAVDFVEFYMSNALA
jgi:hypothetical protein